jgi:hypothetical protein
MLRRASSSWACHGTCKLITFFNVENILSACPDFGFAIETDIASANSLISFLLKVLAISLPIFLRIRKIVQMSREIAGKNCLMDALGHSYHLPQKTDTEYMSKVWFSINN